MAITCPASAVIWEGTTPTILGRITARDGSGAASPVAKEGNLLQQSDISSVTFRVFNATDDSQEGSDQTPSVSSIVFDTIQTSGVWNHISDGNGGNLLWDVPSSLLPDPHTTYAVEVSITTNGGNTANFEIARITVRDMRGVS